MKMRRGFFSRCGCAFRRRSTVRGDFQALEKTVCLARYYRWNPGSTDMLHMFISVRPGKAARDCGFPVPGYDAKMRCDAGDRCPRRGRDSLVRGEAPLQSIGAFRMDRRTSAPNGVTGPNSCALQTVIPLLRPLRRHAENRRNVGVAPWKWKNALLGTRTWLNCGSRGRATDEQA